MKYLIYLRVSTEKQDEEPQLHHCLNYIRSIHPGPFDYEVFRDKITSKKPFFSKDRAGNTIIKREGAKALISRLRKGDVIVAIRLDRIVRSLYQTNHLIDLLDRYKAEVVLVDQPGIKNKIMLGLYAGMAEEEIKLLRKRVTETLQAKKSKGERYSRFLPHGYSMHETRLIPIRVGEEIVQKRGILVPLHEEQESLKMMQDLHSQGYSYQKIADSLDDAGYKNREGKAFQKMTVYRILRRINKTTSDIQFQEVELSHSSLR